MKRRSFIIKSAAGAAASLTLSSFTTSSNKKNWKCAYSSTELEANIMVPDLQKNFTVLQISDSHISCDNENDKEHEIYSKRMGTAFPTVKHYKTQERVLPLEGFAALLDMAKESNVDLLALTGDIINYPSVSAVDAVLSLVKATKIPYFYTAGNHDWHYEGMNGSADQLRAEWIEKRLKPLYTDNPMYSSTIMNGLNFVTIDNSTYQVNSEQLAFYKKQLRKPEPIVLFVHIPLFMPTLGTGSSGHPGWGYDVDNGYEIERRERWPKSGNKPSTNLFLEEVMNTQKLIGIFTGHYHKSTVLNYNNKQQYISGAAFNGQYRMIRFTPLQSS